MKFKDSFRILVHIAIITVIPVYASCQTKKPVLTVSVSEVTFVAKGGTQTITIESN